MDRISLDQSWGPLTSSRWTRLLNLDLLVPALDPALQMISRGTLIHISVVGLGRGILRQGRRCGRLAVDGQHRAVRREGFLRRLPQGVVDELQAVLVILALEK